MTPYDLLFPPRCPYCGELTGEIVEACGECAHLLSGEPLERRLGCGVECISAFGYEDECRKAILNYKYHGYRQYCKPFSITLSRLLSQSAGQGADCITGVPAKHAFTLHRFDHVAELTKHTARLSGIPAERLLYQTRGKMSQHLLDAEERIENVRGLYMPVHGARIAGRRIILADDIVTTGATLNACAGELLSAGAKSVLCLTLASKI